MLRIRKQDSSVSLIEPPITLEKICISICIDKLVHSDDLRRDIARLKIISDDLLEKIIQHPQFIWRRGIIPAILSGRTNHFNGRFYPDFISEQTDTVICTKYLSLGNTRISDMTSMLKPEIDPAELPNTHHYRTKGFIDNGRCIVYLKCDCTASTRLYYSKLAEGFAYMRPITTNFGYASELFISNNFLIVIGFGSFEVWQFVDAEPNLIGSHTHNSILCKNLLSNLVWGRELTLHAVQSILTMHWFRLYKEINSSYHCQPISASDNFEFLLICIHQGGIYSGICICDWFGSVLHRIDFSEVNTADITWLAARRFCISSKGLQPAMLVDFKTELVISPLHLPIDGCDGQINSFIIPDQSGRYLLILSHRLYRNDRAYIYDLFSGKSECLYGPDNYADVLFDSWFIIVIEVSALQENLAEQADALFTKSSALGQQVLQMNPKNHCVILVNLDLKRIHAVEYMIRPGAYHTFVNAKKSRPYLLLNNLVFDARLGIAE